MKEKEKDTLLLTQIAKKLKEQRLKAGYTNIEQFAYECKVPRAQYIRYEKGTNLTFNSLARIIKFHKIKWKDFFSEGFE